MSFLAPLGLGLLLLVALPWIAHSLRSGPKTEVNLPTARFLSARPAASQERKLLEDRALFGLRALLVALLALLAASPFARCSTLALTRPSGGSVALGLVIDDSASMRVQDKGTTRFEQAIRAAEDLLASSREGDSFSVILAGSPARTLVPRTTNLEEVQTALRAIRATERATDLAQALLLARASLKNATQPEKQIAVLSDGASNEALPEQAGDIAVSFPVSELAAPFDNCAILRAHRDNAFLVVETECTAGSAIQGRKIQVLPSEEPSGAPLASIGLEEDGVIRIPMGTGLRHAGTEVRWTVELSPSAHDAIPQDDRLEVPRERDSHVIAVYADRASAGVETSEKTVVELALDALDVAEPVRPLKSLPEKLEELADVAVLIIDNPPGFRPETQNALEVFVSSGGVLLTLLGARVDIAPLSAGFWPITKSPPRYSALAKTDNQVSPSDATLGELAQGYDSLRPRKRVTLDPAERTEPLLSFKDGSPLLLERSLGLGIALTSTLSASVEQSDFALRPGFLGIVDRAIHASRSQAMGGTEGAGLPGGVWRVPDGVTLEGPTGELKAHVQPTGQGTFSPEFAGLYTLKSGTLTTTRQVGRHPIEHTRQPDRPADSGGTRGPAKSSERVPISREIALTLLALSALELWVRRSRGGVGGSPAIRAP
jgi:hypothetical protein